VVPANLTGKLRLKIGQANVIRPWGGVDRYRMGAFIVAAVDKQPARAGRPHFPEGDFLLAAIFGAAAGEGGHAPLKQLRGFKSS
jgi:hypothetical protein